jgi:hypothetical protein
METDEPNELPKQETEAPQPKRNTLEMIVGIAKVPGQPAPTDEEVERWLDERRMEKYGYGVHTDNP